MEKRVKIYALSTCGHCRAAKRILGELGAEPDVVDVDLLEGEERRAAMEEIKKLNPMVSFPTIIVGDEVIVGNREDLIREKLVEK